MIDQGRRLDALINYLSALADIRQSGEFCRQEISSCMAEIDRVLGLNQKD